MSEAAAIPEAEHSDDHDEHHIVPLSTYLTIFATLMVLTVVTVAVAFFDLGALNNLVMLSIAIFKAFLVVAVFMHLKYNAKILWIVAGGGFTWLVVMLALTLCDLLSRSWQLWPEAWL